jgi:hypothetical protein
MTEHNMRLVAHARVAQSTLVAANLERAPIAKTAASVARSDDVRPETTPSVKFTYEDFLNFPDDGKRHEIIDGEHYVTPSPNTKHQRVAMRLSLVLAGCLNAHPLGEVFAAPFDVVFSDLDVVEPDLLYV